MTDTTFPAETNVAYQPAAIPEWMKAEVAEYDIDLAKPPSRVLDIGANVGAYTLRVAQRWPQAEILAYEPVRENAQAYRTNCADVKTAKFTEAAVRRFTGQDLILLADNRANCGFYELGRQRERGYYVDCISSAELPKADVVKIDTEGCELEILERLNLDETSVVLCEWHRTEDRAAIIDLCRARGFELLSEKVESESGDNGILKLIRPGVLAEKKVKLFIGLPIYSQVPSQFVQALLALQAQKPCEIEMHLCQGDGIARSRNQLTAAFLKSDCTHLLFIDCDLIFSAEQIKRILSHDVDVVGGFYPKKQQGKLEWVINTFPEPTLARTDGLHKVAYIGTGFICIKRRVFERMIEAHPEIEFNADYGNRDSQHDLWPMGVYTYPSGHRRYLSEDWYFCQRWMDLGGEVYADTHVILKHIGPAIFPLDTQLPEITNPQM